MKPSGQDYHIQIAVQNLIMVHGGLFPLHSIIIYLYLYLPSQPSDCFLAIGFADLTLLESEGSKK